MKTSDSYLYCTLLTCLPVSQHDFYPILDGGQELSLYEVSLDALATAATATAAGCTIAAAESL